MESLQKMIAERCSRRGGDFAAIDFDNTCIVNDIAEATLAYVCEKELLRNKNLLPGTGDAAEYHAQVFRTYYGLVRIGELKSAYVLCARAFAGYAEREIDDIICATIGTEGTIPGKKELYGIEIAHGLAVRPSIAALIAFLKDAGADVWIVSASPEPIVRAAMRHFGIAGKLIGLRTTVKDGVLQDEIVQPYPIAEGKIECIKKYIDQDKRPLLGASDSASDLPMLEYAEIQVVVDRGNALAEAARSRGWRLVPEEWIT